MASETIGWLVPALFFGVATVLSVWVIVKALRQETAEAALKRTEARAKEEALRDAEHFQQEPKTGRDLLEQRRARRERVRKRRSRDELPDL